MVDYGYCKCGCGKKTEIARKTDNKNGVIKGQPNKYIQYHKVRLKNEKSITWNGGRNIDKDGYLLVKHEGHERCNTNGYVRDHIIIAEKAIGKKLPKNAVIHHYGEKLENGKIVICQDQAYHMLIHRRKRAFDACGNAGWIQCRYCKKYDSPEKISGSGYNKYHKKCAAEYMRKRSKKALVQK